MEPKDLNTSLKYDQKIAHLIIIALMVFVSVIFFLLFYLQKNEKILAPSDTETSAQEKQTSEN